MRRIVKLFLVSIIVRGSLSASKYYYNNVIRKMSATFGHALYACEKAIPITNDLLMELYFYWDKRHPLTEMFGCAVACVCWKMGLISKQGLPREANIKSFIRRHGGDELMIYRFKELAFDCTQVIGKKPLKKTCIIALEIAKCFRIGISYYHWAPRLNEIYHDMTKTISRRFLNVSDDKFYHTEKPRQDTLNFESNYNATTSELNKSHVVNATDATTYPAFTELQINSNIDFQSNHTTLVSKNSHVLNSIYRKTSMTVLNIGHVQSIQLTTPIPFLNDKTINYFQTHRKEANSHCNKTDKKPTKIGTLLDVSLKINIKNEVKLDEIYLKDFFDRFEERERKRDLELIDLYKDRLWFISHRLDRHRR